MDNNIKDEIRKEINKIVDMMVQIDAFRESMASLKKSVKEEYDIPVATITKVATIIRKQNLEDESAKWEAIKEYVNLCS